MHSTHNTIRYKTILKFITCKVICILYLLINNWCILYLVGTYLYTILKVYCEDQIFALGIPSPEGYI